MNLQYAGAGLPWDETVTRGAFGRPPFSVLYLRQGSPIAVAGINDHHTVARARHLIEARAVVPVQQLADPGFALRRALRCGWGRVPRRSARSITTPPSPRVPGSGKATDRPPPASRERGAADRTAPPTR